MCQKPPSPLYQDILSEAHFEDACAQKDTLMILECYLQDTSHTDTTTSTATIGLHDLSINPIAHSQYRQACFYRLDVEAFNGIARALGVMSTPTVLFFKNGQRLEGFQQRAASEITVGGQDGGGEWGSWSCGLGRADWAARDLGRLRRFIEQWV
ncbi:hypothetical protein MBLNU230_g1552t1 [Neophaeotheca triangularis]